MNKNLVDEKELIGKIKEMRQIKPNQNWVFLTKNRILGEETAFRKQTPVSALGSWASLYSVLRVLFLKPAYAGVLALFIIFGLFGFAQNSVPGDLLYQVKKIAERGQTFFASEDEKAQVSLELVNKRLEELTSIVEANQTKKFAPAIKEFEASVSEAANNFSGSDTVAVRKVVEMSKKTKELQSRGVVIEEQGLQRLELESLVAVLENLIKDLENRTLTEKQEEILVQMKALVGEGDYSAALELFLTNQ